MHHRRLAAALALLAAVGCSSSAVEVSTSSTPGATFPAVPTFALTSEEAPVGDPPVRLHTGPVLRERVRAAIEAELEDRRYRIVPAGEADLVVRFAAGVHAAGPPAAGPEAEPGGAYPHLPTPLAPGAEGQVVIEMLHPDSREVLWRGSASGIAASAVDDGSVRRAVRAVLAEFPPVR